MNRFLREPSEAGLVAWAMQNDRRMVAYLLSKGVTPDSRNADGETALTASWNYFEMQKYLVEAGASPDLPNRAGMTPFHIAVAWFYPNSRDPYQKVDYFHGKGADVNRISMQQGAPLHTAASKSPEMVKYLLERPRAG
jgi:ankyrin repeat protein